MKLDKKEVGERIARIRKGLGMSREKFGATLPNSTSRQVVAQWETGIALPSMDRLLDISELGNVDLDYIIKGGDASDYIFALGTYVTGYHDIISNHQEALEGMRKLFNEIGEGYPKSAEVSKQIKEMESTIIDSSKAVLDLCNQAIYEIRKERI